MSTSLHMIVAGALLTSCTSTTTAPTEALDGPAIQPTLTVTRVERHGEDFRIHAQCFNPGPDTWTVETEHDDALARVQILEETTGEWEDIRNYMWCGTFLGWREISPGETLDVSATVAQELKRVRLAIFVLQGAMHLEEGEPRPPLGGPWGFATSEPVELEQD
jgi:hypothetical protein